MTVVKCNVCGQKMRGHDNKSLQFREFPLDKKKGISHEILVEMDIIFKVRRSDMKFNVSHCIETDVCNDCKTKYLKQIFKDFRE